MNSFSINGGRLRCGPVSVVGQERVVLDNSRLLAGILHGAAVIGHREHACCLTWQLVPQVRRQLHLLGAARCRLYQQLGPHSLRPHHVHCFPFGGKGGGCCFSSDCWVGGRSWGQVQFPRVVTPSSCCLVLGSWQVGVGCRWIDVRVSVACNNCAGNMSKQAEWSMGGERVGDGLGG